MNVEDIFDLNETHESAYGEMNWVQAGQDETDRHLY
jgi:hypothetical protein